MALRALTTAESVEFVSTTDPDYKSTLVPRDPADPDAGTMEVITIGDTASRFRIRPLDVFLMAHIYDNASSLVGKSGSEEVGIKTRVNQTNIDTVRFGLVGLPDNWGDPRRGSLVKFAVEKVEVNGREYTSVTEPVLRSLGLQLIQEMATKIKAISEVSADDEGNSEGASLPSG